MKKSFKKLKTQILVLLTIVLTLYMVSCDRDEFENLKENSQNNSDIQIKKINFLIVRNYP